jgi:hypothetical protein
VFSRASHRGGVGATEIDILSAKIFATKGNREGAAPCETEISQETPVNTPNHCARVCPLCAIAVIRQGCFEGQECPKAGH